MVVGYILRQHPSWIKFIELSHNLGKPLVMRMNLNQQSEGSIWIWHQDLMSCLSLIVDCGVHYVDVMMQMTRSKPTQVYAIGARLTEDIPKNIFNYGQLQIRFDDGSVGWYEAGWGPRMSETAFFIKDVIGPKGSVSIVASDAGGRGHSDSIESHSKTGALLVHDSEMDSSYNFKNRDSVIELADEPNLQELSDLEQVFFYRSIVDDIDLKQQMQSSINTLEIVEACEGSMRTGKVIGLNLTYL